jgi:hypothetical protein
VDSLSTLVEGNNVEPTRLSPSNARRSVSQLARTYRMSASYNSMWPSATCRWPRGAVESLVVQVPQQPVDRRRRR